jgi:hypothetical protein
MAINEAEILAEALGDESEEQIQPQGFRIDTIDKLDWAIRKWSRVDREAQQKIDCAKRQIERLKAYIEDTQAKANQNKAGLEAMMEPFVKAQLEGAKTKTFKAPSGNVQLKSQKPEITRDDDKLVKFLKGDREEYIKTVETPKWDELKEKLIEKVNDDGTVTYLTAEGEIVDGVTGKTRPDKLVVKGGC